MKGGYIFAAPQPSKIWLDAGGQDHGEDRHKTPQEQGIIKQN